MRRFFLPILLCALLSCSQQVTTFDFSNAVIPQPSEMTWKNGVLDVPNPLQIVVPDTSAEAAKIKNYLTDMFAQVVDIEHVTTATEPVVMSIDLVAGMGDEAYTLDIDERGIHIVASTYRGAFYAVQTLRQLLPPDLERHRVPDDLKIQYLSVADEPLFGYRGMHLDVCRHFFTVDELKTYIDMLAMHKFNVFHWHLTDDQGWRIAIDAYPNLAAKASQRQCTVVGRNTDTYDTIPYGGYYTHDDIREVVRYAESCFITVIPEIEMPGHALAALSAYPQLGCRGAGYATATCWGVFDDVFCAGKEETFAFLEKVIDEVCELFPHSPYIHIGGDECPKANWAKCPYCQSRIKAEKLHDESELQSYFVRRIERYVNSKGRRIIGWDEILEGGLAPDATVMSWRGEKGGIAAAKQNHDVVMTPTDYCYFDYYQSRDVDSEPLAICCFIDAAKIYSWNPLPAELTADEQRHILGVQANVWTEYIATFTHLQYMTLPRMAAMAEVAWSKNRNPNNYPDFKSRLQQLFQRYNALGYNYAKHECLE